MKLSDWMDFKIRNRYLDLPDENYTPTPIAKLVLIINKMYTMFSVFGVCWWVVLYSSFSFDPLITTTISFIIFCILLAMGWMVLTKSLPLESFLILLIFLIGSSLIWVIKISP